MLFDFSSSDTLKFWATLIYQAIYQTSQRCNTKLFNLLLTFLCYFLINWTYTFFLHNKYALIFIEVRFGFILSSLPQILRCRDIKNFLYFVLQVEIMFQTKTMRVMQRAETNQKWIEKEHLPIKSLSEITFYESKLRYKEKFFNLFFFLLLICELQHIFL